jgi:hypothetical protein
VFSCFNTRFLIIFNTGLYHYRLLVLNVVTTWTVSSHFIYIHTVYSTKKKNSMKRLPVGILLTPDSSAKQCSMSQTLHAMEWLFYSHIHHYTNIFSHLCYYIPNTSEATLMWLIYSWVFTWHVTPFPEGDSCFFPCLLAFISLLTLQFSCYIHKMSIVTSIRITTWHVLRN